MKTAELSGVALNWAVAICEGYKPKDFCPYDKHFRDEEDVWFSPSDDWAQGGAIIERENINFWTSNSWQDERGNFTSIKTAKHPTSTQHHNGETPLIAAMRCYVSSKLGDEVELPEELEVTA